MGKGFKKPDRTASSDRKQGDGSFYVLLRPDTEEFFASILKKPHLTQWAWCKHPSQAKKFSFEQAKESGLRLAIEKRIELQVCCVSDLGERYKVETVERLIPFREGSA